MKQFKLLILLLLSIAVAMIISCSKVKKTALTAGYIPSASAATMFHAMQNSGENSLQIESFLYKSSNLLAADLAKGQIQIALVCGLAQIVQQISNNWDSIIIIAIYESTPCFLVPSNIQDDITTYLNIGKKTVGCWPGAIFPQYTKIVLDSIGVDNKNLYIIPISPSLQVSQILNGDIDALFTLEPVGIKATNASPNNAKYAFKNTNLLTKYISKGEYFPGGCLALNKDFHQKNPKVAKKLIEMLKIASKNASSNNPITIKALGNFALLSHENSISFEVKKPIIRNLYSKEIISLLKSLVEMKQIEPREDYQKIFVEFD